ncbi:MAG TPA: DmsC/YnfH family molybdoenzyme membrane anchor subunit [Gemmataceae bacterium]|nr:DmsC/YnfH family molybdoenzyme membrane anchor subunit [Gemmataceae bacterium]
MCSLGTELETGCAVTGHDFSLVDLLLREQVDLSAVERFAQSHRDHAGLREVRNYAAVLPASPPREGEQYAFEVDLDSCSGCKACVTACHQLNGLDKGEAWRNVGLLHGGTPESPVLQHVTTACHHCLDPACLNGCPVRAYTKDPQTGIVRHLDDQCIGCQYCIFACPYDVPKYNRQKGIVRKCDMCSDRLSSGEPPACVQACPHGAIRITVVGRQEILDSSAANQFLPGAPAPSLTLPTTHYKSRVRLPRNLLPADYYSVRPEHAHLPLVVMLVLTQLSVGAFLIQWLLRLLGAYDMMPVGVAVQAAGALGFGLLALAASVFHLGRPRYAFRAILGLGSSWLSREILAFGMFAATAIATAAAIACGFGAAGRFEHLADALCATVVVFGLAGVFFSVMVYQCTGRDYWNGLDTLARFALTTLLLGLATTLVLALAAVGFDPGAGRRIMGAYGRSLGEALMIVTAAKLLFELTFFRHLWDMRNTPLKRSALLLASELAPACKARFLCGAVGGIALPWVVLNVASPTTESAAATALSPGAASLVAAAGLGLLSLSLAGELCERYLFFAAVVPPRMPGGPTP